MNIIELKQKTYTKILFLLFLPLALLVVVEGLQRSNVLEVFHWIVEYKSAFIINYIIILTFLLVIFSVINNLFYSLLLSTFFFVLVGLINYNKMQLLGEPFFPWDVILIENVIDILPRVFNGPIYKYIIYLMLGTLFVFIFKKITPAIKANRIIRVLLFIVSLTIIISTSFYSKTPVVKLFGLLDIQNQDWQQDVNYQVNGVLLSFTMNVPNAIILKPENYSEDRIKEIAKKYQAEDPHLKGEKPNIVVIMSEAYWDITKFDDLSFSENPVPTYKSNNSGSILSPSFGGYTANVEFEFLTGMSMNNLPSGSIPYEQYIKKEVPSLASTLSTMGYKTVALHTYPGWFYNRDEVYKSIGFDEFISEEKLTEVVRKGPFIADSIITKNIIEQIEKNEQPLFTFAVTMQNHGGYTDINRYEENTIKVTGDISNESLGVIETYTQGAHDADLELNNLISYLQSSAEPTMLVFFGDHLPLLGEDYGIYRENEYIEGGESKWSSDTHLKMKSTPLVMWKNIGDVSTEIDVISPSFLGSIVLSELDLPQNRYYKFLSNFSSELPGYTRAVKMQSDGKLSKDTPEKLSELEEEYELIQYDILFGENYSKKYLLNN